MHSYFLFRTVPRKETQQAEGSMIAPMVTTNRRTASLDVSLRSLDLSRSSLLGDSYGTESLMINFFRNFAPHVVQPVEEIEGSGRISLDLPRDHHNEPTPANNETGKGLQ